MIVPTRDDPRIGSLVDALRAQTLDRERFEVVIADNASREASTIDRAHLQRDLSVRVVREHLPGSYRARNAGLCIARGHLLAFTDADCLPAADWLEAGMRLLAQRPSVDLVAGHIAVHATEGRRTAAELYELVCAFPQRRYVELDRFGATANLFVRRKVFDVVGTFDADLRSGGDREFCNRAVTAGHTIVYAADAVVHHPARRRLRDLRRKQRRTSAGVFGSGMVPNGRTELLRGLRPPVGRLRRARVTPHLTSPGERWRYALVLLYLHYALTFDRVRHLRARAAGATS